MQTDSVQMHEHTKVTSQNIWGPNKGRTQVVMWHVDALEQSAAVSQSRRDEPVSLIIDLINVISLRLDDFALGFVFIHIVVHSLFFHMLTVRDSSVCPSQWDKQAWMGTEEPRQSYRVSVCTCSAWRQARVCGGGRNGLPLLRLCEVWPQYGVWCCVMWLSSVCNICIKERLCVC